MLTVSDDGPVRTITLDRPDRRNALDRAALEELRTVIAETPTPVAYIHGAGSAFCAGADLSEVRRVADDPEGARSLAITGHETMDTIEDTDTVVVAGIDGAARGGGVELALACDVRIATPSATMGVTGVTIGIFGAWGGTRRLPAIVGRGHAMDLALSGRVVDATSAHRMGLVSRVVDDPASGAATIGEHDAEALKTIKRLVGSTADRGRVRDREAAAFAALAPTAAHEL